MSFLTSKRTCILFLFLFSFMMQGNIAIAQSMPSLEGPKKSAARYEIDAKRIGSSMYSEDALPRSREFKRIDSTYYVGWMYEGVYKYEHAADYIGFKNASEPLERALRLMERDYGKQLRVRTGDLIKYYPVYSYHYEYTTIAFYLLMCYNNMEKPELSFDLLKRVNKWNFQRDYFNMDVYNHMAWLVHRHRYHTSSKYPFLANSIDENEKLAHKYLDSQLRRIRINKRLNDQIFRPGYAQQEMMSVYHYKSILHSYALNIDSAAYYYNKMKGNFIFPHNNYATFRSICGDFREAEMEYENAMENDGGDKRLREWAYYTSTIDIYKAQPEKGTELMRDMIKANGSTPGFGWYNIALARAMHYSGKIPSSERYINKAAEFKELHIGTTLGQSHYDFSTQMVKLLNINARLEKLKFEHKNWWYNPKVLAQMAEIVSEKYSLQFLIINQFAQNPERDRVIYKIFSTESTISWDEVWYLIRDYSTNFFIDRFEQELKNDKRIYIKKYFRYFIAKLKMKSGDYKEARILLDQALQDENIDVDYEKLFLARVYQAQAECAKEGEDNAAYAQWMYKMYLEFPELIPYSGLKMPMNVQVNGDNELAKELKDRNIDWQNSNAQLSAYVFVSKNKESYKADYYVVDTKGKTVLPKQSYTYTDAELGSINLAYRLFNIGESPVTDNAKVNEEAL